MLGLCFEVWTQFTDEKYDNTPNLIAAFEQPTDANDFAKTQIRRWRKYDGPSVKLWVKNNEDGITLAKWFYKSKTVVVS